MSDFSGQRQKYLLDGVAGPPNSKRDQSISSARSSSAWTGETPQTPPSPLRFLMQNDEHSINTPSKDKGYSDVIDELHDVMWRDVRRRKSDQYNNQAPQSAATELNSPPLLGSATFTPQKQRQQNPYQYQHQIENSPRSFPSGSSIGNSPMSSPFNSSPGDAQRPPNLFTNKHHRRTSTLVANQFNRRTTTPNRGQHHRRNSSMYSSPVDGGDARFRRSQLQTAKLTSMLNRSLFGCKGEDPRCAAGTCACNTPGPPGEPGRFVFRLRTSFVPPTGRKPIRISDGLNPHQPFDFSRFETPPRRELYPFQGYHIELEDCGANSGLGVVDQWLARWQEKNSQPFSRPAQELQWHIRMQNKEIVNGFKHPIFPEYDGLLTLPHLNPGVHFRDVRPGENKTLQDNAMWASSRPKLVTNANLNATPRHIRIFKQLAPQAPRHDKPPVLNQILLGDLRELRPTINRLVNGEIAPDETTFKEHPELYVFNPRGPNPGTPTGSRKGSNRSRPVRNGGRNPMPKILSFDDPRIKQIFMAKDDPKPHTKTNSISDLEKNKTWPMEFAILRSYKYPVNDWPDMNVLARTVEQRNCPHFDGKGGFIYFEEHTFPSIVDLMANKDPVLAPMVQNVTSSVMKRWLEMVEPAYTAFEGNRHIPMSPYIPTPRNFGRWAEFRYVPATGHWILYFFPKPLDWKG